MVSFDKAESVSNFDAISKFSIFMNFFEILLANDLNILKLFEPLRNVIFGLNCQNFKNFLSKN